MPKLFLSFSPSLDALLVLWIQGPFYPNGHYGAVRREMNQETEGGAHTGGVEQTRSLASALSHIRRVNSGTFPSFVTPKIFI